MAFTVDFEELHTFPRSVWEEGQFLGTRLLKCAWSDRVKLLLELDKPENLSWTNYYSDGPSDALLFKVKTDPLGRQTGAPGSRAEYAWALLTCWYRNQGPLLYANKDLISEWIEGHYEGKYLPWGNLRWNSPSSTTRLDAAEVPEFLVGSFTLAQTWHRLSSIATPEFSWIYKRTRSINPTPYACFVLPYVFPAGTMLYMPPRIVTTARLWGLPAFDVTVRYAIHPSWADGAGAAGWNSEWRQSTAQYEPMYISGGGQLIKYRPWTV